MIGQNYRLTYWIRIGATVTILILLAFFSVAIQSCCTIHPGSVSDHFDGRRFHDPEKNQGHTWQAMIRWLWRMEVVEWPDWISDPSWPAPPAKAGTGKIRVTLINQATILIQIDHTNILTDPIWSFRAGPFTWLGARRIRTPGVKIADLPKIDLILISHDHYDHLDRDTISTLSKRDRPLILAGLGVKRILNGWEISEIEELDWWQNRRFPASDLNVVFVPARHNSGRGPLCRNNTLWGGFVIQSRSGNIYFAGDTAYGTFLQSIRKRFPDILLAILPVGSYEKRWFMRNQHMNPEDAIRAHLLLQPNQSMGIHYATFLEHPEQTIDAHEHDLSAALKKLQQPESSFWLLKFGEGRFLNSNRSNNPSRTQHER